MASHVAAAELGPTIHTARRLFASKVTQQNVDQPRLATIANSFLGNVATDEFAVSKGDPPVVGTKVLVGIGIVLFSRIKVNFHVRRSIRL